MEEHCAERVLSTGRRTVDPHAADVVERVFGGDRLVPQNAVRETRVSEVLPRDIMKRLGPIRRTHPVDLHDDEANLRLRLHPGLRSKCLGDERILRARVDVLDDRILLVRIEIHGPDDDAPDISLPVAALRRKNLWWAPAGREQRARISTFHVHEYFQVTRPA